MSRILVVFIFFITFLQVHAQDSKTLSWDYSEIHASNGSMTTSKGTLDYVVGASIPHASILHNSNDLRPTANKGITQQVEARFEVKVYPNPASDYIFIDLEDYKEKQAQFQLFDYAGRMIEAGNIQTTTTKVALSHLKKSYYLLKITVLNQLEKTIPIIKN
ncbi:T9SS type A sorting domain-containing protein [Euzebyella saccharophila]|uniref:T9SS type A sorting domain-containing protein n=1 Tax=Euzebyella saccharophila TaxID=679664 RepID=A0ABV8JVR4_9FLAO|nr:T9SS type A sorting domain-containing protein [Euzebyella saccharophila]